MKKLILVIGDTIIDRYHYLNPVGLSLETPTLKCTRDFSRDEFGGAANVAKTLSSLGCDVDFYTSIEDGLLEKLKLDIKCSVIQADCVSQIKERFYITKGETYKYLQINDVNTVKNVKSMVPLEKYDMVVISDYRLGVVQDDILKLLPKNKTICQMQVSDSSENLGRFFGFHGLVGNSFEIPHSKIKDISDNLKLNVCVSTNQEKEILYVANGIIKRKTPNSITGVKDYHGAGDAFYAGFCSKYDFKIENLDDSVSSGIAAAKSFLLRSQNVK